MKTQRDKFEEWAKDGSKGYVLKLWTVPTADGGFAYTASLTSDLWQAWCAAIESVAVQMPELTKSSFASAYNEGLDDGLKIMHAEFQDELDRSGIKYE